MIDMVAWFIAISCTLFVLAAPIIITVKIFKLIINKIIEIKDYHAAEKYRKNYKPPKVKPFISETGWIWNEKTQMWDPPESLKKQEALHATPKNQMTTKGTYRYDYVHMPSESIKHYHHTDTNIVVKREVVKETKPEVVRESTLTQKEIDLLNMYREMTAQDIPKTEPAEPRRQEPAKPTCQEPEKGTYKEEKSQKQKKGYEDAYEARQILSYNERRNYKTLLEAASRKGYTVQIKMRLADIVGPKTGDYHEKYYKANFQRISQYHVDFAILNDRLNIVAVIELDDNSHDRQDRKERDEKIDSILEGTNIKIIHTRHITPDILDNL